MLAWADAPQISNRDQARVGGDPGTIPVYSRARGGSESTNRRRMVMGSTTIPHLGGSHLGSATFQLSPVQRWIHRGVFIANTKNTSILYGLANEDKPFNVTSSQ